APDGPGLARGALAPPPARKASREAAGTSAPRTTLHPRCLGPWPHLIEGRSVIYETVQGEVNEKVTSSSSALHRRAGRRARLVRLRFGRPARRCTGPTPFPARR